MWPSKVRIRCGLCVSLLLVMPAWGCFAKTLFRPPALNATQAWVRPGSKVGASVEILIDDKGVPHIYAQSTRDVVYGLGYMHGRDRLFHLDVLRRAATGRLSEMFGSDLLQVDVRLRILSYRLDEALAALSASERDWIQAYGAGIEQAVADDPMGSLEHKLLGLAWQPLTARDVIAMGRLQSWQLSGDFEMELLRARVASTAGERAGWLLPDMPSMGVPIVPGQRLPFNRKSQTQASTAIDSRTDLAGYAGLGFESVRQTLRKSLGLDLRSGSNSFVIAPSRSSEGVALLENDTHLEHRAPGVFYLAQLVTPDLDIIGYTFPGLPAVLIGSTPQISWGFTTSYVDVQDLYRLKPAPGRKDAYLFDDQEVALERWPQRFVVGHGDKATTVQRMLWASKHGPLINAGRESSVPPDQPHALAWAGFAAEPQRCHIIEAFFDLYRARDVNSARRSLAKAGLVFQNAVIATSSGEIGYVLAGLVPRRAPGHDGAVIQDGSRSDRLWQGYLDESEKPFDRNPPPGFIVAANQRVSEGAITQHIGRWASYPYRSLRLRELISSKTKLDIKDLRRFQVDVHSVQSPRVLPTLLANWPDSSSLDVKLTSRRRINRMAQVLGDWDHRFAIDQVGASIYDTLYQQVQRRAFAAVVDEDVLESYLSSKYATLVLDEAMQAQARGQVHPLLGNRAQVRALVSKAVIDTEADLRNSLGPQVNSWRWGRAHPLTFRHPLGRTWPLDAVLNLGPTEMFGCTHCVAAESGRPVYWGASMRTAIRMGPKRQVYMILDTGNAGYVGSPNYDNMSKRFVRGQSWRMAITRKEVEQAVKGRIVLSPEVLGEAE